MRGSRWGLLLVPALSLVLLLASCGPRTIGHAVVLWGPTNGPENGAVLPVIGRSALDKTVTLWDPEPRARYVMEAWRVRDDFRRRTDAVTYAAVLESYGRTYAFTDRSDGLPIRSSPAAGGAVVYRLRPRQPVRVLSRTAEMSAEGEYEDYWYEALTNDGYRGYIFGHFLEVYEASPDRVAFRMTEILAQDPVLDELREGIWRPEYFREMMAQGRIDLRRFSSEIGLYPDPDAAAWILRLADLEMRMPFDHAESRGSNLYAFPPSALRIAVYTRNRIEVTYVRDGRDTRMFFVRLSEDLDQVVARETERRTEILDELREHGDSLTSSAYGSIDLEADGRFRWAGHQRVPPGVFARPVSGAGRIDFPYHLPASLAATYAGAVSFVFDEYRETEETVFLFAYVSGGLQLTRVREQDIQDLLVRSVPASPLVMFFSFRDS